jgi:hypothetical protein
LGCALVLLLVPCSAWAHVRSTSWSTWTLHDGGADVRVRVSLLDLSALPRFAGLGAAPDPRGETGRALTDYLTGRVRLSSAAGPCAVEPGSEQALEAGPGHVGRGWRLRCGPGPLRVESDLLLEEVPTHLHFATLERGGVPVAEGLLTGEARAWSLGGEATAQSSAGLLDFVALGARHVASGADHLVFLLALLVAAGSLRSLAGVVTGFTLGHSATLALAVLGGVRPDAPAVEALVGASIAAVAVENVWLSERDPWLSRGLVAGLAALALGSLLSGRGAPVALGGLLLFVACYFGLLARAQRPERLRWAVAALFGTVHGFAFSGALAELCLPRARLAGALFGFNLGVELAQLGLLALAWPLWRLLSRTPARGRALLAASAAALCAGTFWLVDRTFG